jgi:hypothetical protein
VRYNCEFEHRDTGEHKTIPVALTAEQVASVETVGGDASVLAMAYALNAAYRVAPKGYLHTEPPALIHPS